ncbi:MAG: nitrite reductase [Nocardioides sp.]|uniref:nitrite reductase n=1 Tax=Nocardioides sp. TaxID=35761 RepID=UPI003F0CFE3D
MTRSRPDMCPGVLRPWPADDGLLVRLRLPGGRLAVDSLLALSEVAQSSGDGRVRLTSRANLQVRGLPEAPGRAGVLPPEVVAALAGTGLLPSAAHDVSRNLMASPTSGLDARGCDVRPYVRALDEALLADPAAAALPGRFLFLLDDGRGDLVGRTSDLAAVGVGGGRAQLRVGGAWSDVVAWSEVPARLVAMAAAFLAVRGAGAGAAWHVDELPEPLWAPSPPDPGLPDPGPPLAHGATPAGLHVAVGPEGLTPSDVADLASLAQHCSHVVVTPWRGVLVPQEVR